MRKHYIKRATEASMTETQGRGPGTASPAGIRK